jgi:DNA-binding CsgD family transcriptional regulator
MERQSASVMLGMGAAPAEVATQLARSAEPGDKEAVDALRQAAQSVGRGDASAAADLSRRALELSLVDDAEHGSLVAETVEWLNRATRYDEAQELAVAALAEAVSPEVEAEIRLRLPTHTKHSTERRVEENRRALQLSGVSDVTRARHQAWLAYNLVLQDKSGQPRAAADEAAAAAAATGDLEASVMAEVTHALLDSGEGYAARALGRLEQLRRVAYTNETASAHAYAGMFHANLLAVVGRLGDATARVAEGIGQAGREGNSLALATWTVYSGWVHLAAGRLSAARDAADSLPPPLPTGATEQDVHRMLILAEVSAHTDDRNSLQQTANDARDAHSIGSPGQRRASAYVLARAAWYRDDVHEAARWLNDASLLGTPLFPHALVRLILGARVASAAGDAGLRARVLEAAGVLERERPAVPLLAAVAGYARGILERDGQALVAVAGLLEPSERPLLYASAAEDAGAELARTGRAELAIEQLIAAFDTYTQHEAVADARRVGRALRRLGVERRIVAQPRAKTGWDSLTESEVKVINLIAEGATNRAVAERLHLSPHTVKTHLHNAFAKLAITSRAQLAQLVHGSDDQSFKDQRG